MATCGNGHVYTGRCGRCADEKGADRIFKAVTGRDRPKPQKDGKR